MFKQVDVYRDDRLYPWNKLCDEFKICRTRMEASCCEFKPMLCSKTQIYHCSRLILWEPYIWCKMMPTIHHRSKYPKGSSDEGKIWLVYKMCMRFPMSVWDVSDMFAIDFSQTSHKHLTNISATFWPQLPYQTIHVKLHQFFATAHAKRTKIQGAVDTRTAPYFEQPSPYTVRWRALSRTEVSNISITIVRMLTHPSITFSTSCYNATSARLPSDLWSTIKSKICF